MMRVLTEYEEGAGPKADLLEAEDMEVRIPSPTLHPWSNANPEP